MTVTMTEHLDGFTIFAQAYNPNTTEFWRQRAQAHLVDPDEEQLRGEFRLNLPNPDLDPVTFRIIASDYANYALFWGCENARDGESSFEHFMLLTRMPMVYDVDHSPELWARIEDTIDRFVDRSHLRVVYQDRFT
jgi:hypothetical protein